jgi:hypothetical protein
MDYFVYLRDLFVNNFSVSLKSVEYKKYKCINGYLFFILRLIPFYFLKSLFNSLGVKYIYLMDNIYFSNYCNNKILPIIISVEASDYLTKIDITSIIKKYSYTVPFWYIIENENLKEFKKFQFKYFSKSKLEIKLFDKDTIQNKLIQEIFLD